MQQIAIVKRLLPGNKAELEVQRQTACGHDCTKCGGCGEMYTKPIMLIAQNTIGANVGDAVRITGSTKEVLGLAAIVYMVPLVLFLVLYAIAEVASLPVPGIWGGIGFFGGLYVAKIVNDRQKHKEPVYTITKL